MERGIAAVGVRSVRASTHGRLSVFLKDVGARQGVRVQGDSEATPAR
jgi:hypothetical protein